MPFECAGNPALHKAAGFRESDAENPIRLALPLVDGVLGEQDAGFIADFKVVHAEVGGIGVGHIDGDERDLSLFEDMRDVGSYVLLHLEFEGQVDALAHKVFRVLDGDIGIVAVVELEQFHSGRSSSGGDAGGNGDAEGHLRALRGETEAEAAGTRDQAVLAALALGHVAAMNQGFQDPIDAGLGDVGLLIDVLERDGTVRLFQEFQNIERLGENRNQV